MGGVLAVLILAFQLYLGVIPKDVRSKAWWSIAWPYLILLVFFLAWHCIRAWWEIRQEDKEYIHRLREHATAQAALLWTFEAQARELLPQLEEVWHHWNNAGDALLRPLDTNDAKSADSLNLQIELRDFKLTYGKHLQRLALDVPDFSSKALTEGYPSSREYIEVLYDLREHARTLNETAQKLYTTGIPL
jgi:hypothetical protein